MRRRGSDEVRFVVEAEFDVGRVVWGLTLSLDEQGREQSAEWGAVVPAQEIDAWESTLVDVTRERVARNEATSRTAVMGEALRWKMDAGDGKRPMPFPGPAFQRPAGPVGAIILGAGSTDGLARGWHLLRDALQRIAVYTLYPPDLRATTQEPRNHAPMDGSGADWMSALRSLERHGMRDEFRAMMAKLVPDLVDYRVQEVAGVLVAEFVHGGRGDSWSLNTLHESDGTLRCAALLVAMLQEPLPSLLCIEEPELAIHVGALPVLVDQILVTSTLTPVMLTTHSPDVIDLVPPQSLRVVERSHEGTSIRAVDARQQRVVREHLATMGTLLREEGLAAEGAVG
jgi:hypothetical protein